MGKWYAIQRETTDDWGTGSYNLEEATEMAKQQDCHIIAVIENDACIEEIEV